MNESSAPFERAQFNRDHSLPSEYWAPPEPEPWGDELWEEKFCDKIAENFIKDGGTLPEFKANITNIAERIASADAMAIEGHGWEYLAEEWLDAGGGADDFLRLYGEIAGRIV